MRLASEVLTPARDKNSQISFVTVIKLQHKRKWRARRRASADLDGRSPAFLLLDGAANVREYIVGVRANESDRAHDDYQNYSQHHRILGDILATFILPKLL